MKAAVIALVAVLSLVGLGVGAGVLTSIPWATDQQLEDYAAVTKEMGLEISAAALLAVDAVRFQQDFSRVNRQTIRETADLFAMCAPPQPLLINQAGSYEGSFTVHRLTSLSWQVDRLGQGVTVEVFGDDGQAYGEGSELQPGTYRVQVTAPFPEYRYRVLITPAVVQPCGREEVELVMDRLGLVGDDREMVIHIMATLLPPEQVYLRPDPNNRYAWPVGHGYPITSRFGHRLDPVDGTWRDHQGVDVGAPEGTMVVAAADGVVLFAGLDGNYGRVVRVDHGAAGITTYAHLSEVGVATGQLVLQGSKVGLVGNTGKSTGPHLHFEWWIQSQPIDPLTMYRWSQLRRKGQ